MTVIVVLTKVRVCVLNLNYFSLVLYIFCIIYADMPIFVSVPMKIYYVVVYWSSPYVHIIQKNMPPHGRSVVE